MKQFNGLAEAQEAAKAGGMKLPAGAYVCRILGVKFQEGVNGNSDAIVIQFDIEEGEYKGFFKSQYETSTQEDKKYKGKTSIYCPKDDGTEKDGWTKKSFGGWINALEASNTGYKWDWDENKWKNKVLGIVFGETGTAIDGKAIIYTEARFGCDAQSVRDGKAPVAKFKEKEGYRDAVAAATQSKGTDFMNVTASIEEELPWD